jgi:TonB family protein
MPSTLFRLAVALLTFGLGVSVTTFWIAYRTPEVKTVEFEPFKKRECHARPVMPLSNEFPLPPLEEPPPPKPLLPRAPVSGGVLDGKVISRLEPIYPRDAIALGVSGKVVVKILVDEYGQVISARAVSGNALLQHEAVQAAYQARFAPTRLSGQPVKVSGTISYNFVLP